MARDYAAVPHEYLEEMQRLGDAAFGRLIRALLQYSRTGEPIAPTGSERFYAERVMAEEDRHRRSYEELCSARSRAGRAGAAARWQGMANAGKQGNTEPETESEPEAKSDPSKAKRKGPFSTEKRPSRGRAAPEKKDNSWMREYD